MGGERDGAGLYMWGLELLFRGSGIVQLNPALRSVEVMAVGSWHRHDFLSRQIGFVQHD